VVGLDYSKETTIHAAQKYSRPNLCFVAATAQTLPFRAAAFDLVVAFELIEHLNDYRALIQQVRDTLASSGLFIVSTPNREYYAESRRAHGPNPFHAHEFDFDEFTRELGNVFPHVISFVQNHADVLAFTPVERASPEPAELSLEPGEPQAPSGHFFVAICALTPLPGAPAFVHLPRAANVLQEREHHIAKLEQELARKNEWLKEARDSHAQLVELHRAQTGQLEASNRWADQLNKELESATVRIRELDTQILNDRAQFAETTSAYEAKINDLETENVEKTQWAKDTEERLGRELAERTADIVRYQELLTEAENTLEQRTRWALDLEQANRAATDRIGMIAASRWVRLGRLFGVGPEIRER
jgi:SAM-dependent methyltransferase